MPEASFPGPVPDPEGRAARMREKRRRQIVAAAREVFAERGYHAATVNDVIGRAKIARGTFYLYFEGKRHVFESLLEEALAELRSRIRRIDLGEGAPPPAAQLRENIVRVLRYLLENRDFTRLLLSLWRSLDGELRATASAFYEQAQDLIESSLVHGIRLELLRPLDTRLAAAALLGTFLGVIGHVLDARAEVEALADQTIDLALSGVGIPGRWAR
jgi:AcrR family transcriptional regulator